MKYAQVFPGQGSQFVGMGKDLFDQYDEAKKYFLKANKILDFKLLKSCLRETKRTNRDKYSSTCYIHSLNY